MAENQQYQDSNNESAKEPQSEAEISAEKIKTVDSSELSGDLDDLLDEIDQVLETNAEEFVKSYVQKGGQ
tara:strand:+ start:304 stop:513 length:210 start_codon:yes stop_codon:yes gene_type:complete